MYTQHQIRITIDNEVKLALEFEAKNQLIKPATLARVYLTRCLQEKGLITKEGKAKISH